MSAQITTKGAVAAVESEGAEAAAEILRAGGNAIDASIAGAFAQTVVDPWRSSIAGGAHIQYYRAADRTTTLIDAGGVAPAGATPDMFTMRERWENAFLVQDDANLTGYRAQTIPSFVRGMDRLFQTAGSGNLTWAELLAPAIRRAREGFRVHPHLYGAWRPGVPRQGLERDPSKILNYSAESRRVYLKADGSVYRIGELFRQPDLADTLETLASAGADDFYTGSIAHAIADDFARNDGVLTLADLQNYEVGYKEPIYGNYRGYRIATEGAPSVGPTIIQALNILEVLDLAQYGWNTPEYTDLLVQVLFAVFKDRDLNVGDPDFVQNAEAMLTSDARAAEIAQQIRDGVIKAKMTEGNNAPVADQRSETTHITAMDDDGNVCGITHSVGVGTGVVTPGLGFMHNCHMINYDPRPGQPNSIAPGKKGTGGGAPVFVFDDDRLVLSMGSPAGALKASAMVQVLANTVDFNIPLTDAVSVDRIHVRAEPPLVLLNSTFEPRLAVSLGAEGYRVEVSDYSARVAAVSKDFAGEAGFRAASDNRGDRGAIVID